MTILLAEAVKLKSILLKKQQELTHERHRVAFKVIEKGQSPVREGRTLADVEHELRLIRADIRKLDRLVYEANAHHTVDFDGQTFAIVEAIELAKQLRAEVDEAKEFAMAEQEELQYGYSEAVQVYKVALFDPEHYRKQADELEKKAHKLSNLINAKNFTVSIDFDDSRYM